MMLKYLQILKMYVFYNLFTML